MTQTAVQWLLSELQIRLLKIKSEPDGIVREKMINSFLIDAEQAEAMEKEQLNIARLDGINLANKGYGKYYFNYDTEREGTRTNRNYFNAVKQEIEKQSMLESFKPVHNQKCKYCGGEDKGQ